MVHTNIINACSQEIKMIFSDHNKDHLWFMENPSPPLTLSNKIYKIKMTINVGGTTLQKLLVPPGE